MDELKHNKKIIEAVSSKLANYRKSSGLLRMTPMIDVIFLLLIFFMITARFAPVEQMLPIKLPAPPKDGKTLKAIEPLVINLNQTGNELILEMAGNTIHIIDEPKEYVQIAELLQNIYQKQKRITQDPVELTCNNKVEWNYLAKIYNLLYGMGISNITFPLPE